MEPRESGESEQGRRSSERADHGAKLGLQTQLETAFSEALDEALAFDEISAGMDAANKLNPGAVNSKSLKNHIRERRRVEIWRAVADERSRLEDLEGQLRRTEVNKPRLEVLRRRTKLGRFLTGGDPGVRIGLITALAGGVAGGVWSLNSFFLRLLALVGLLLWLLFSVLQFNRASHAEMLSRSLNISGLEDRVAAARADLRTALREKAMLPTLRALLSEHLASNSSTLEVREAPGLGHLIDPLSEIETSAAEQLKSSLEQLPGGSIGIAGPRGAGKTTLLHSFCAGLYPIKDQTPTLAVEVSAPVQYAPREFILHLFAKLCLEVLGPQSAQQPTNRLLVELATAERRRIPAVVFWWTGVMLAVASIGVFVADRVRTTVHPRIAVGIGLVVASIVVFGIAVYRSRLRLRGWLFGLEIGFPPAPLDDPPGARWFGLYTEPPAPLTQQGSTALQTLAADRLREIQFQQIVASGWSGGLKLPIGLEAGLTGTTTLAQQQLGLPDVVGRLREFIRLATASGLVVIGIDELDKVESPEQARQFLNDIKSVFGIKDCYFLISVSEDAIASFERRGMPFRDVFDSSFDEIITVRPLDFHDATRLLRRRVIGLGLPFEALCYCLSGGVARDLIRTTRKLLQEGQVTRELAGLCEALVRAEVIGKTEAVEGAMKGIELEPAVSDVLRWCNELDLTKPTAAALLAHCQKWLDKPALARVVVERPPSPQQRILFRLTRELVGFYYYCATLLEVFTADLDPAWLQGGASPRSLDRLAGSRQAFAINARLAWDAVSDFRKAWAGSLKSLPFPDSLLV
jgi:hypothetical protein